MRCHLIVFIWSMENCFEHQVPLRTAYIQNEFWKTINGPSANGSRLNFHFLSVNNGEFVTNCYWLAIAEHSFTRERKIRTIDKNLSEIIVQTFTVGEWWLWHRFDIRLTAILKINANNQMNSFTVYFLNLLSIFWFYVMYFEQTFVCRWKEQTSF